ncbi:MAG TPA: MnhB domain-containing protein [Candidatus Sabulitectum sp.]|nr:MnhB domain-containing protein [Candidatus Sabulitectum sp.]HPJ29600.1 MnhB domain-containing protein [Candidatus Sabulitectum sp.]HPR22592.1 MnhB domain-containing protein [Candidatus Sabulitectum sp.]
MTKKTSILDLISRKLAPFMLLFGFYLLAYGHASPGGGFQGGVVISSGVILLVVAQGVDAAEKLFPFRALSKLEAAAFTAFLAAGFAGIALGMGFLGNPMTHVYASAVPRVGMALVLNLIIGIEVGSGISLICLRLFRGA